MSDNEKKEKNDFKKVFENFQVELDPEQIAEAITRWVKDGLPSTDPPASIDWLENG